MNCTHHMWDDPAGPVCTRSDLHDEAESGGHVYESRDGSFTNQNETTTSGGAVSSDGTAGRRS
jgi:predicted outer membrane repeat protein